MKQKALVLSEIYRRVGSRSELARKLGISRAAVSAWDQVPVRWIKTVSEITKIPKKLIRPDLYD